MSKIEEIIELINSCSEAERLEIFKRIRAGFQLHPFETALNTTAEIILEALGRAPDLTVRGIRGIIGEATFAMETVPTFDGWEEVTPEGNHSYDSALRDSIGTVRVQVKMQRRTLGVPMIKRGMHVVEVQRTRNGKKAGEATRPYRFGEFDILAVCMEPSHKKWNSFFYIPDSWLIPRSKATNLIDILQPIPLTPDQVWTDDYELAVRRWRSGGARPADLGSLFE